MGNNIGAGTGNHEKRRANGKPVRTCRPSSALGECRRVLITSRPSSGVKYSVLRGQVGRKPHIQRQLHLDLVRVTARELAVGLLQNFQTNPHNHAFRAKQVFRGMVWYGRGL